MAEPQHQKSVEDFGKNDDFWLFGYGSLIWKPPPHYDQRIPGCIEGYVRRFWQASEDHRGTPEAPGRVVTLIDRAHWDTLADHDEPTERVWGAAYHIPTSHVAQVREYLDIREINGYSIQFTPFHPAPFTTTITSPPTSPSLNPTTSSFQPIQSSPHKSNKSITASTTILAKIEQPAPITCLVYIGLPSNPQFLGPQDPDVLARHILKSRGPSGENREYLVMLERGLLELSKDSGDRHVSDLVKRCRDIEAEEEVERVEGGDVGGGGQGEGDEKRRSTGRDVGEPLHKVGSTEEQEEVEK